MKTILPITLAASAMQSDAFIRAMSRTRHEPKPCYVVITDEEREALQCSLPGCKARRGKKGIYCGVNHYLAHKRIMKQEKK